MLPAPRAPVLASPPTKETTNVSSPDFRLARRSSVPFSCLVSTALLAFTLRCGGKTIDAGPSIADGGPSPPRGSPSGAELGAPNNATQPSQTPPSQAGASPAGTSGGSMRGGPAFTPAEEAGTDHGFDASAPCLPSCKTDSDCQGCG